MAIDPLSNRSARRTRCPRLAFGLKVIFILSFSLSFSNSLYADDAESALNLCERSVQPMTHVEIEEKARELYGQLSSIDHRSFRDAARFDSRVKVISDPQEGFLAKIMMIRRAKYSIDIGTYVFKKDEVGLAILKELKDALARGVDIQFLVDSQGSSSLFRAKMRSLLDAPRGYALGRDGKPTNRLATVHVRVFNPLENIKSKVLHFWSKARSFFWLNHRIESLAEDHSSFNRRMHDKILAVDVEYPELAMALTGGRNLTSAYYGLPEVTSETFNDMEILIKDAPSNDERHLGDYLGVYFNRLFYFVGNKELSRLLLGRLSNRFVERHFDKMEQVSDQLLNEGTPVAAKMRRMVAEQFFDNGFMQASSILVNELHNISRENAFLDPEEVFAQTQNRAWASIIENFRIKARRAKNQITIVSPYIYFTDDEINWMIGWLSKDPARKIRVVTNSVASGDNMLAQAMVENMIRERFVGEEFENVRERFEIYQFGRLDGKEYGGAEFYGKLHAKFAIIDDEWALVTTNNGDPRSRYLNSEVGLLMNGKEIATELLAQADSFIARSYRHGTPEWKKLNNHPKNRFCRLQLALLRKLIKWFYLLPII